MTTANENKINSSYYQLQITRQAETHTGFTCMCIPKIIQYLDKHEVIILLWIAGHG
uniref:Uncharacterized protein n=1 Tax=Lepeophtheirus salmonis TaxID=72036 RepID=A0A0K2V1I1_LEPSM